MRVGWSVNGASPTISPSIDTWAGSLLVTVNIAGGGSIEIDAVPPGVTFTFRVSVNPSALLLSVSRCSPAESSAWFRSSRRTPRSSSVICSSIGDEMCSQPEESPR